MTTDGERFHPTNGRVTGILGLVIVAAALVAIVLDDDGDFPLWAVPGAALAAAVIWIVILRPGARTDGHDLVLRNMLDTRWIPLASVDRVAVGHMLVVVAGDRRYTNSSVGRTRRQSVRDTSASGDLTKQSYGAFVEERITRLATDARDQGIAGGEVRRHWAWPEIAALALSAVALLVAIAVA